MLGWKKHKLESRLLGEGIGWGGRQEGGLGWGTHVNPWLIHVSVWQKPLQYCKIISLQLIKINEKEKIARRNINNLRYADDTTLIAESEEELESLLMKVKEKSEKVG